MWEKEREELLQDYRYRKNILQEITLSDIEKWNSMEVDVDWDKITNKPSTFPPSTHTHNFEDLLEKPTTLAGYGITDVYTKDEIQDNTLNKIKATSGKVLVDTGFNLGLKDGDNLISYNYGISGAPTLRLGSSAYISSYMSNMDIVAPTQLMLKTGNLNLKTKLLSLQGSYGSFSVDVSDNKGNNKLYASIPAEFTDIVKAPRINIYSGNNTVLEGALWNSTYNINGAIKDGLHLSHENGKYLALAYKNASTGIYNSYMILDVEGVLRNDSDGDDWGPVRFEQNVFFRHGLKIGGGEDIILAGKGVNTRITALENAISQGTGMVEWNNVLNKPNTFTPSSHKHAIADVTNLQTTLDSKAPKVYENQVLYGSLSSNFRTWLIGGNKVGGFAKPFRKDDGKDSSMPQFGAGIAWGQADTNGMLCVDYINPTAYIAGGNGDKLLWSKQLAWKDDLTSYSLKTHNHDTVYSKISHNHAISDITNLQSALDGKAASNHSHSYLPLSGGSLTGDLVLNATSEQRLTFNNCSKSKLQTYFYKGNSTNSTTILGLWDPTNKEPIWKVNNDWSFEVGKQTIFSKNVIFNNSELTFFNKKGIYGKDSNGAEQRIAVISDACYLGGTNIPTYIRSSVTPQYLDSSGNKYNIYHSGNFNPSDYAPKIYENKTISGAIDSKFRTTLIGTGKICGFALPFRKDDNTDTCMPQFGSGIAWGQGDTHGMLYVDYSNSVAYIAGGNGDKLNWHKKLAWKDDLTSYLPLSGGTITGNINFMNAVLIGRTITGEASNEINHRIVIGGAGDDKMLFDEYGGDFYFRRTKDGTINQMARITSDGIYEGATLLKDKYALIGHSHTNISPLGRKAPMTGRNAINGIYCYSTSGDDSTGSTMPSGYCVVIGFGDGTGGSAEIAISYTGNGMWFRYLRDYQDNWSSWTRLK